MFRTTQKYHFFSVERIWFSNSGSSVCDIIRYTRSSDPLQGTFVYCDSLETILSDLSLSSDEILARSSKTIKYEVNKCRKDDIPVFFYNSDDISFDNSLLDEFEKAYLEFATNLNNKELLSAYNRNKLESLLINKCLLISKSCVDDVSVYHVYAYGGKECCLLYSVSNFREKTSLKAFAGRINKYLHIVDMDYFRAQGIFIYDWGNISSSKNPNGIDLFKMSFGGTICTLYNISKGNTLKGKVLLYLLHILRKK